MVPALKVLSRWLTVMYKPAVAKAALKRKHAKLRYNVHEFVGFLKKAAATLEDNRIAPAEKVVRCLKLS